jgi:glycosyltransferase involved in cell wall biosynthesis
MRVGLFVLGGGRWLGGVSYVRTIARMLGSLAGYEPVLLLPNGAPHVKDLEQLGETFSYDDPRPMPRVLTVARGLVGRRARSIERGMRAARVDCALPSIISLGARAGVPWIGWLWDFQHVERPDFFSVPHELTARNRAMRRLACEAPHLIASSYHARDIARRLFPWLGDEITALRFPAIPEDAWYERDPTMTAQALGIDRPYVYLPNQFWKHKDHETAFRAWARLASPRPLLVCTGDMDDYRWPGYVDGLRELLRNLGVDDDVKLLGRVARQDQMDLFRGATAVLNSSHYEGWSTTVEEARALGKRLVLTDIPLFREQAPEGTRFFPASDPQALAARLEEVLAASSSGYEPARERAAREAMGPRIEEYGRALVHAITGAVERGQVRRCLAL